MRLGDSHRDGSYTGPRHKLDPDSGGRLERLEVVDELGKILDRVDVVVRRRRDEGHSRLGMSKSGDLIRDLVAGQLPAFSRLRALGHLDLELVGRSQVSGSYSEPSRGHLLDHRVARCSVPDRVLSSFARVGGGTKMVHRLRQGLVRFSGEGPVRHRRRGEPPHDPLYRLDLRHVERRTDRIDLQQIAQFHRLRREFDQIEIRLVLLPVATANCFLQRQDRPRRRAVGYPSGAVLVVPLGFAHISVVPAVTLQHGRGDVVESPPFDARRDVTKGAIAHRHIETDRLEQLAAAIRRDGANSHLRHDLEQSEFKACPIVLLGLDDPGRDIARLRHRPDMLNRQVCVDGGCAKPDEACEIVGISRFS